MRLPFEADPVELETALDDFVAAIFSTLQSEFLVLPKGEGFIDYPSFERAYEALKRASTGFTRFDPGAIGQVAEEMPLILIVLRAILRFTPPEWAYVTSERTGLAVGQGFARGLDRRARLHPFEPLKVGERIRALIRTACELLGAPPPSVGEGYLHRLHKADTAKGADSVRNLADLGVPYSILLYERFLGRPFAGHRDSVSELVGDGLETAIEEILSRYGISYRKTKRAERLPTFDQAPDFVVPDEFAPRVVIEAKVTEDDGTARDKVTRIQHLAELSMDRETGERRFQVVACIAGRGFGVRRADMKKLLLATEGKVFTRNTLDRLVACTDLRDYRSR